MTIDVNSDTAGRLAAFRRAIDERLGSLNAGEKSDGEEVMARLIAEICGAGTRACRVETRLDTRSRPRHRVEAKRRQ